jgi:hypothetical protein
MRLAGRDIGYRSYRLSLADCRGGCTWVMMRSTVSLRKDSSDFFLAGQLFSSPSKQLNSGVVQSSGFSFVSMAGFRGVVGSVVKFDGGYNVYVLFVFYADNEVDRHSANFEIRGFASLLYESRNFYLRKDDALGQCASQFPIKLQFGFCEERPRIIVFEQVSESFEERGELCAGFVFLWEQCDDYKKGDCYACKPPIEFAHRVILAGVGLVHSRGMELVRDLVRDVVHIPHQGGDRRL